MIVADMSGANGSPSQGTGKGPALGSKDAVKVAKKVAKAGYVRQAKRRRERERD